MEQGGSGVGGRLGERCERGWGQKELRAGLLWGRQ